jgi:hypothetical protein
VQNEKMIAAENEINEMKLKMLIKFDQIKFLQEFYNQNFEGSPEQQIRLDLDVDEYML